MAAEKINSSESFHRQNSSLFSGDLEIWACSISQVKTPCSPSAPFPKHRPGADCSWAQQTGLARINQSEMDQCCQCALIPNWHGIYFSVELKGRVVKDQQHFGAFTPRCNSFSLILSPSSFEGAGRAAKSCIAGFIWTELTVHCSWDLFLVFLLELQVPGTSVSPLRHMGRQFSLRLLFLQAWENLT